MDEIYQKCFCSAYGCPMNGTMSDGFGTKKKWWCWLHYGRDVSRFQAITAEINRLSWLALAIRDIRSYSGSKDWPKVYMRIKKDIGLAQRNDLQFLGNSVESKNKWLRRLEEELKSMMQPVLKGTMLKQSLLVKCNTGDTFAKALDFTNLVKK